MVDRIFFQSNTRIFGLTQYFIYNTLSLFLLSKGQFLFLFLQSSRMRLDKLIQSTSTEESIEISNDTPQIQTTSAKQTKQTRLATILGLGLKTSQQNQLCDILNYYLKNGVPQSRSNILYECTSETIQALAYMENIHTSWQDFIAFENLTSNEIKMQSVIWELVTTEADYIHTLQTIIDVSRFFSVLFKNV